MLSSVCPSAWTYFDVSLSYKQGPSSHEITHFSVPPYLEKLGYLLIILLRRVKVQGDLSSRSKPCVSLIPRITYRNKVPQRKIALKSLVKLHLYSVQRTQQLPNPLTVSYSSWKYLLNSRRVLKLLANPLKKYMISWSRHFVPIEANVWCINSGTSVAPSAVMAAIFCAGVFGLS